MRYYNVKWNIPYEIGRALKDGRVVISNQTVLPGPIPNMFNICRSVFGGKVRSKSSFTFVGKEINRPHSTILVSRQGVELILIWMNTGYASMGLQEFLMRTWKK